MTYLGLDLGTSGLRGLLIDETGSPLASAESHYTTSNPHSGWSEQNPRLWIRALDEVIEKLRSSDPGLGNLKGIGVAGHMHGATLLDEKDHILRDCILWNDTRASDEANRLDRTEGVREVSGNIVFPGFTAPKLLWVKDHEPEIFERIAKVLLPTAYLNFYLTGEYVSDMSDAAGTSWLDVEKRQWSPALLNAGGMQRNQMPSLVEGSEIAGYLRDDLRRSWGVEGAVTVAGGAGDNAAAACGVGAIVEGAGFVSLGTSGVILTAREQFHPAPETAVHTFCHAVPDRWYQMGVILAATDSLNWLSRITGAAPSELTGELGALKRPGSVRFLPYLSGERTPHNDPFIRASFSGLGSHTDRKDLTRAVLEGVTFGLRQSLEALRETGASAEHMMAIGGGAKSRYWTELLATAFGIPISLPTDGEFGAAMGAARLAVCASSGADPDSIMSVPKSSSVIEPKLEFRQAFDDAYCKFKAAYAPSRNIQ